MPVGPLEKTSVTVEAGVQVPAHPIISTLRFGETLFCLNILLMLGIVAVLWHVHAEGAELLPLFGILLSVIGAWSMASLGRQLRGLSSRNDT